METLTRAFATPGVNRQGSPNASALADAEARAAREKSEMEAKRKAEEDALKRGLRGVRSLFSGGGGFLGFPEGKSTLGG